VAQIEPAAGKDITAKKQKQQQEILAKRENEG
jgi:hypothetical protein